MCKIEDGEDRHAARPTSKSRSLAALGMTRGGEDVWAIDAGFEGGGEDGGLKPAATPLRRTARNGCATKAREARRAQHAAPLQRIRADGLSG